MTGRQDWLLLTHIRCVALHHLNDVAGRWISGSWKRGVIREGFSSQYDEHFEIPQIYWQSGFVGVGVT